MKSEDLHEPLILDPTVNAVLEAPVLIPLRCQTISAPPADQPWNFFAREVCLVEERGFALQRPSEDPWFAFEVQRIDDVADEDYSDLDGMIDVLRCGYWIVKIPDDVDDPTIFRSYVCEGGARVPRGEELLGDICPGPGICGR